jgi:hypothetical protein
VYGSSTSIASLDGWVSSTGTYTNSGLFGPQVGDLDSGVPGTRVRSYFSFDVPVLPPGARVRDAVLSVRVTGRRGDPYLRHGNLEARYLPYGGDLANVITAVVANPPPPASFTPANADPGWKDADVTTLFERCVADGLTRFQVEVDFDGAFYIMDSFDDIVFLGDGDDLAGQGHAPTLFYSYIE